MIGADRFVEAARQRGFCLYAGVPCSYFKPFINYVIDSPRLRYIGAANEGDAVAIAAGSELGGRPGVVMFQNSGLGNAVNPLTSLTETFRLPLLLIVTLRGEPGGVPDEPQHAWMGQITTRMLELIGIPWEYFPEQSEQIEPALDRALEAMRSQRRPWALVMRHGAVEPWPLRSRPQVRPIDRHPLPARVGEARFMRAPMLRALQASLRPTDVVVATTGFTGRELYAAADLENQFYMVGSMGCASSFGLGLALAQPTRRVIVLDGDGALLMRMGALATIGYQRPGNLVHILLDNQAHESTGGQATVSHSLDLCGLAAACGYPHVARASTPDDLQAWLQSAGGELTFLHVPIQTGVAEPLPRPALEPAAVAQRLRDFLRRTS